MPSVPTEPNLPTSDPVLDRIELRGLTARGYHGVFPEEKREGQDFVVDVTIEMDARPAAASDNVVNTISYADVAEVVVELVTGKPVDLIETLADRIARRILLAPRAERVQVTIHKPQAPIPHSFGDAAVTVTRTRMDITRLVVSLGSNMGDRFATIQSALARFAAGPDFRLLVASTPVETPPWGPVEQPPFLNVTAVVATSLSPREALAEMLRWEKESGRQRDVHWGPRTLDIDIITAYRGNVELHIDTPADPEDPENLPALTIPHPHAKERLFVLLPWAEIEWTGALMRLNNQYLGYWIEQLFPEFDEQLPGLTGLWRELGTDGPSFDEARSGQGGNAQRSSRAGFGAQLDGTSGFDTREGSSAEPDTEQDGTSEFGTSEGNGDRANAGQDTTDELGTEQDGNTVPNAEQRGPAGFRTDLCGGAELNADQHGPAKPRGEKIYFVHQGSDEDDDWGLYFVEDSPNCPWGVAFSTTDEGTDRAGANLNVWAKWWEHAGIRPVYTSMAEAMPVFSMVRPK